MNIQDVLFMYDYNYWADKCVLAAAEKVTQEQFLAPGNFPHGGLRGTLVHTLNAEFLWRRFLLDNDWIAPDLKETDFPTLGLLQERWRQEEQEFRAYLATLHDEDMDTHRYYTNSLGEHRDRLLWHCLMYVVTHGIQHRSETAALLTDYGSSPGDIDLIIFLNSLIKS